MVYPYFLSTYYISVDSFFKKQALVEWDAVSPGLDAARRSQKATEEPVSNPVGAWVVTITRYLALIALYGGVVLVVRDGRELALIWRQNLQSRYKARV